MTFLLTAINPWPPMVLAVLASMVAGAIIGYAAYKEFW